MATYTSCDQSKVTTISHFLLLVIFIQVNLGCNKNKPSIDDDKVTSPNDSAYLAFKPSGDEQAGFWKNVLWVHPETKSILKDPDFSDWLYSQDTSTKNKINTANPDVAISLISQYKSVVYYQKALNMSGIRSNMPQATELLRQSVMYGNMKASFYLGELYRKGDLVEQSRRKAFRYLTKARLAGIPGAKTSLKKMGFMRYDQ